MTELNLSLSTPPKVEKDRTAKILLRVLACIGLLLVTLSVFSFVRFFLWARCFDLRGFRSGSGSMCPAVCEKEKFLVGMDAFNARPPQRGDVILFEYEPASVNYLKRVIAVAGDTVARGPQNTILVNGRPLVLPPTCGKDNSYWRLASEGPDFQPVTVPKDSLFVVGDNLDNSFDSRMFGPIGIQKARAKALLIYWSPNASRIGCRVE
jgi:signal peptidase I